MGIYEKLYEDLRNQTARFYFAVVGIFVGAIFSFLQWGLPLYWQRQPNFKVAFTPDKNGVLIVAEALRGDGNQCLVTGTVTVENEGVAPISIQNTHIILIPFEVEPCGADEEFCVVSQNTPTQYREAGIPMRDIADWELMGSHHHVTLFPVTDQHDLFSGATATRAFSLLVPRVQLENERMMVLAVQEFGPVGCTIDGDHESFGRACVTSRASVNVPFPCQAPAEKATSVEAVIDNTRSALQ